MGPRPPEVGDSRRAHATRLDPAPGGAPRPRSSHRAATGLAWVRVDHAHRLGADDGGRLGLLLSLHRRRPSLSADGRGRRGALQPSFRPGPRVFPGAFAVRYRGSPHSRNDRPSRSRKRCRDSGARWSRGPAGHARLRPAVRNADPAGGANRRTRRFHARAVR